VSQQQLHPMKYGRQHQLFVGLVIAGLVAVVGSYLLFGAHAQTPVISIQPEAGSLTGGAVANKGDSTESGGAYIQFAGPPTVVGKRFTSTAAMNTLAGATTIAQAQTAIQSFASQYGLTVEITAVTQSASAKSFSTYSLLSASDLAQLKTYGYIFIDEWAKYPVDWVHNSKAKDIIIVKNLDVSSTLRAAMPDPAGEAMYYDIAYASSATGPASDYAREVIHHEFDHLLTYNYFGSYAPLDLVWALNYNAPGFTYGNGGASCYHPGNTCLSGPHPIPGFVSGYAASAIEEDKAETYGYLMTDADYQLVKTWIKTDSYLAQKVTAYKQFIASHSPEMSGTYFDSINP